MLKNELITFPENFLSQLIAPLSNPLLKTETGFLTRKPQIWGILSNKYNLSLEFTTMCSVKY